MGRLRIAIAVLVIAGAAIAARSHRWPWHRFEARMALAAPPVSPLFQPSSIEVFDTLRRGETLGAMFQRRGVVDLDLSRADPTRTLDPRRLRAGLVIAFRRAARDSAPTAVRVRTSPEQLVTFTRASTGWTVGTESIAWRVEPVRIESDIDNSLYEALDGISSDAIATGDRVRLAWDLADVFAWEVDFTRDIQPGDHFAVVFERLTSPEGQVRFGRILASDLTMSGKRLTAVRFDSAGASSFYDPDGASLRRAFLRAPVEFRRISSTFARGRFHPILGMWRKHEGTDYAAAPGTPVMAAGDGVVLRAGSSGGYGNLIELRHRNGITTRYGHLRGFARGIHGGARVTQGEVIGYVGSTGLATGPHLHYEFRVNGVARDSRRVELAHGTPISAALRPAFEQQRDSLLALLRPVMVAISR